MKYAIVDFKGQQYKVSENEEVEIDLIKDKNAEDEIIFENILLLVDDKKIEVGEPFVKAASVKAKVLEHFKGEKIRVSKFKAKARYRRSNGFRAKLTRIKVEKIVLK